MPAKFYSCAITADGKNSESLITISKGMFVQRISFFDVATCFILVQLIRITVVRLKVVNPLRGICENIKPLLYNTLSPPAGGEFAIGDLVL